MNFITINQYFNKLQIAFLVSLMGPLLVFIAFYFFATESKQELSIDYYLGIPALALLAWFLALTIFNKKIKSVRNAQGLGAKLEKYFSITIVRYCLVSLANLILAGGFYVTRGDVFTALYLVSMVLSTFFWPTGRKVSGDLMLRGDEREMVYFRKDKF